MVLHHLFYSSQKWSVLHLFSWPQEVGGGVYHQLYRISVLEDDISHTFCSFFLVFFLLFLPLFFFFLTVWMCFKHTDKLATCMSGVGKNTIIQVLSAIVGIGGYFKFERVLSLLNSIFPFPLVTAFWIGIVWTNRGSGVKMFLSFLTAPIVLALLINFLNRRCNLNRIVILQIRSATPIQDMNTSAPILLGLWRSRPIG